MKNQVHMMGAITKKLMGLKRYSNRDYVGAIKITDIDQASDACAEQIQVLGGKDRYGRKEDSYSG
jgi:hypothetical protein